MLMKLVILRKRWRLMDRVNINNTCVIPVDDKVLIFVKSLGFDIDPEKLRFSLCTKSYIFDDNHADKIEHLKLIETLGYSLLSLIACIGKFTDCGITNKQLTAAVQSDKHKMFNSFYKNNNLNDIVLFGKSEEINRKDFYQDIVCQVIFSIYEQSDFYKVYEVLNKFSISENSFEDYKTLLQEYAQRSNQVPRYRIVNEVGPDHAKQFEVELTVMEQTVKATSKSKKLAEKEAAKLYILKNNIQITNNKKIESSPIRLGQNWSISSDRRKNLITILDSLSLDPSKLPLYMLDACFTHKSYLFENKGASGESLDNLSFLGSMVLSFCIDLELTKCFETICGGLAGRLVSIKAALVAAENLSNIFLPEWLPNLKRGNGLAVLESTEVKSNIIQAIFGAIFLNAFRNKAKDPFDIVSKVAAKLVPIQNELEFDDNKFTDYTSWLQTVTTYLGFEHLQTILLEEGLTHNQTFIVGLRVFHPTSNDLDFISEGTGRSKKEATKQASKMMLNQIKKVFNLSGSDISGSNSENWKCALKDLIALAIKPGIYQHKNLELLGGLCLQGWSEVEGSNILCNLLDTLLFSEIRKVYEHWVENNLSEEANVLVSNHFRSKELLELIGRK